MRGRVRAYLGMSLDGRIAGPDDDLDWLDAPRERRVTSPVPATRDRWLSYDAFVADVGLLLMGRRTFDVVRGFRPWPYGATPVVVATTRDLGEVPETVTAAAGAVEDLVAAALAQAGGRDVYVDGGRLVSAVLDAGLLDELTTTILPTVRGPGVGLFDTVSRPHELDAVRVATDDSGAVQVTWVPRRPQRGGAGRAAGG